MGPERPTSRGRGIAAALLLSVGLMLSGLTAAAADELQPFEAAYAWQWHGMTVAVSRLKLEREADHWVYASRSEPRGLGKMFSERPVQRSVLRVTASGVQPLSYKADDGTSATKRDADVLFDWDHNRATGVYEDTKVDLALQPGVQDDLSIQVALMVELLAGRAPAQLHLIDKNAVREYLYTREGTESLDTALGRVDTVIYAAHKANSPRVTRFWCAPAQGYIPMRVEQKKDGEVQWSMQVQSLQRAQVLGSVTPN